MKPPARDAPGLSGERIADARPAALTWRVLDTPPARGAWNMAVDAALVESVRCTTYPGTAVLRFYRWAPACLSLGRNQPARGEYDLDGLRRRGVDIVRRPTGGRAVLHDCELTYSVVCADGVLGSPRQVYAIINRALVAGLRRLGVPAELQPGRRRRAPSPSLAPCFVEPVEGEVVARGRKLVGSAQRREGGVILQHGSLLLEGDQSEVGELLRALPERTSSSTPIALSAFCTPLPDWETLTGALLEGWEQTFAARCIRANPTAAERRRAADIARDRFDNPAWTWRA